VTKVTGWKIKKSHFDTRQEKDFFLDRSDLLHDLCVYKDFALTKRLHIDIRSPLPRISEIRNSCSCIYNIRKLSFNGT